MVQKRQKQKSKLALRRIRRNNLNKTRKCSSNAKIKDKERARKEQEAPILEREGDTGDEWISCQTDANKLVKKRRPIKGSLFGPDESWPEEVPNATVTEELVTITTEVPIETNDVIDEILKDFTISEEIQPSSEEIQPSSEEIQPSSEEIQPSSEDKSAIEEIRECVADEKKEISLEPEEWVIKKQLCRCCLVEGTFDSMHSPALGEDISYDDMLVNSFNIQLFPVSSDVSTVLNSVCGLCAARLRDAYAFRHQVIASEERFQLLYTRNCITVTGITTAVDVIELKEEGPDDDNDGIGMNEIEDFSNFLVEGKRKTRAQSKRKESSAAPVPKKKTSKKIPKDNKFGRVSTNEFLWVDDEYKCTQCEKTFTKLHDLRVHFKKAHRPPIATDEYLIEGKWFKCTRCGKLLTNFIGVQKHIREVHLKMKRLKKCKHCEGRFKSETQLILHILEAHNIDLRHKCGACDKVFNKKQRLYYHKMSYHMLGEIIKCSVCDYETYTRLNMSKHMVAHQESKDFHCKYCKKSFPRRGALDFHERIHTGDKRKVCAECGQAFVQKASLNYHMAKYHPEVKF